MKKIVNLSIIGLAAIVLVFGIVASCMTLANYNVKTRTVHAGNYSYNLAEDGRQMVSTDVAEGKEYLQVKSDKVEVISSYQYQVRELKHAKIVMNKAKSVYEADKGDDSKKSAYDLAVANYNSVKASKEATGRSYFTASAQVFFGTYFPIVVLLGIGFLINQKITYKKES